MKALTTKKAAECRPPRTLMKPHEEWAYSTEPESTIFGVACVLSTFGRGVRANCPLEQTGSVGYAFARTLRGRHLGTRTVSPSTTSAFAVFAKLTYAI
jgi:hypothetical protein